MQAVDDRDSRTTGSGLPGPLGQLQREAARMPLLALTLALEAWQRSAGVRSFAMRRGNEVLQIVAHTPLGRFLPQPFLDDGADDEAARIATQARKATAATAAAPVRAVPDPKPEPRAEKPAPKPAATPKPAAAPKPAPAPEPPAAAVEAGAPGVVTDEVERITEALDVAEPTSREDLPIPDFDNISIGSLRARLRSLSAEQLVTLREWEQAHAHRLPVITLLDNRIAKVAADVSSGPGSSGANATNGAAAADEARKAAQDEGGTLRV